MASSARPFLRKRWFWRTVVLLFIAAAVFVAWWKMIGMPGKSFKGSLPPLSTDEVTLRDELKADVEKLATGIGVRSVEEYAALTSAAAFIESSFSAAGYTVRRDGYDVRGRLCENLEVELRGTGSDEIIVIGGHYDTVHGSPGANDNGSGVAATLALARRFAATPCTRTIRFVAFVNEEPGHFQTELMGSWVYASRCKERGDKIVAMMSLETIGYYSDERGSQKYPLPLLNFIYPNEGNFIAFVGDTTSKPLVQKAVGSFRKHAQFPSEGTALPASVPGIGWSDHWAFWQHGYPGLMVTDTAPFRYPYYHSRQDTPDKLNYDSMARVVAGLEKVIRDLASAEK
jgi:hypothetical protein